MATQQKGKKTTSAGAAASAKKAEALARNKRRKNIWSVVLFAIGLMIAAFAFFGNADAETPNAWDYIHGFFCGVFGATVFFVGPLFIYLSIMIGLDKGKSTITARILQGVFFIFLLSAAIQIIFVGQIASPEAEGFGGVVSEIFNNGKHFSGGGFCALLFGYPLLLLGRAGATIIIILVIFVIIMLMANISLITFLKLLAKPFVKLGGFVERKRAEYEEESQYVEEERERLHQEEMQRLEMQGQGSDKERLAKKFSSLDAMTKSARNEKPENLPENDNETKAIIEKQREDSEKFLKNIGAEPVLVPPRLTDEDYRKNEDNTDAKPVEEPEAKPEAISGGSKPAEEEPAKPAEETENAEVAESAENIGAEENCGSHSEEKSGIDEIEQAINDYNRELEEKNSKGGIVVETVASTAENVRQTTEPVPSEEEYILPPVRLLNEVKRKVTDENINTEIENNATTLVNTLKSFGVSTKFLEAVRGPSVTRYELQPAPGVKISKITGLVDDISLNLATAGVRIEAPIPNKAAVGIEVPNREKETVFIKEMIDSGSFRKCDSKLASALGKNISGEVVICDIAEMPHILIAGTTGAGKSVCVNSIIMSILYRSTPDEVRLVMIDPKAVEFMIYNGIGHLLLPVVTDPKKAAGALAWACTEMDKRYNRLSENNVRDIKAYNKLAAVREDLEPMPQVVIFIDELADLMMCSKNDVEASICRLAQKARAAGMHLVVATQRPSVDVITGLIKSNIPSRIALKVASQVDSRTIIDNGGAEKLLGKGDMLYKSVGMAKPMRVQGCWVSDEEVERVTEFIKNKFALEYDETVMDEVERQAEMVGGDDKDKAAAFNGDLEISDEKLDEAIDIVFSNGGASTSLLQRKINVGYGRAARLIDMMEQMGIVGPQEGKKPRELLMSKESWYERKLNKQD
ncbi:MAG: DNA translocase FtsK [Firmicutes bacterium]|nr:DNA translocase FtsK [[Eubacterium] siraeum]MCM1487233.1 DNA translocase FtsK [Bacillota bacterium]